MADDTPPTAGDGAGGDPFERHHDAGVDPLTGLPQREHLHARIAGLLARKAPFALLFFDLDHCRWIKDSLGHEVADQVLAEYGRRLVRCFRHGDVVCRLGIDEFAALIEGVSGDEVRWVADRVQGVLSQTIAVEGRQFTVTASLGVALGTAAASPDALVLQAEMAMLRARDLGRASQALYEATVHRQAVARLALETDLRLALERDDELSVDYQAIVSLETGRIHGFEALARWNHPLRGQVPPGEFIPAAEETGLIMPLGRWVLRAATRQLASWRAQHRGAESLWVSVNVSGRQVSPSFAETVSRTLEQTELPAQCLRLELTESSLMRDREVAGALWRLHEQGVKLSVDDFGTGYSSLSKLDTLPITAIKVDRSFTSRLYPGGTRPEITAAIVGLGRQLGVEVIAEGIESSTLLDSCRELGCQLGQGYFVARPAPPEQASALLRRGQLF